MTFPGSTGDTTGPSPLAIIGALVVVTLMALAAVLFIQGTDSTQRIGIFFGLVGVIVTGLLTLLRSDQTKTQTNGAMTALQTTNEDLKTSISKQVEEAVANALSARRADDPPSTGGHA